MSDRMAKSGEITSLLRLAGTEPNAADRLWALVYPELRKRAAYLVRNERSDRRATILTA